MKGYRESGLALPTDSGKRIAALDIMRGFAVMGIFVVNIEIMNCIFMNQDAFSAQWTSAPDALAVRILQLFFYSKFFPIFSFLFGLGISMQAIKRSRRGGSAWFFLRRMAALFTIGAMHVICLWGGDVLHLYALLGLLTLLILRLPATVILAASFIFLLFPYYEDLGGYLLSLSGFDPSLFLQEYTSVQAREIIRTGTYIEGMKFRLAEYVATVPLLYFFLGPVAVSMFMMGVYFGKNIMYN
ncbi:MAG: DUF418 domain-containing protein, partial [Cyclobacteriaceae bacterium]